MRVFCLGGSGAGRRRRPSPPTACERRVPPLPRKRERVTFSSRHRRTDRAPPAASSACPARRHRAWREPPPRRAPIAAICSGVDPQQPPTMLTKPLIDPLADEAAGSLGLLVIFAEIVWQAGVRDRSSHSVSASAAITWTWRPQQVRPERAVEPHRQRLRACRTVFQNASTEWPDRLRPDMSVIGHRDHHRHLDAPRSASTLLDPHDRCLGIERIEDRLDQDEIDSRRRASARVWSA